MASPTRPTQLASAPPLPRLLLSLTALVTLAGIVALGWWTTSTWLTLTRASADYVKLQQHIGDIRLYDEMLTMSCRMATLTGDAFWVGRYNDTEPKLRGTLEDAIRLAPSFRAYLEETRAANDELVHIERRALMLVDQGALEQAASQLADNPYKKHKTDYGNGMTRALGRIHADVEQTLGEKARVAHFARVVSAVVILLIIVLWALAWRALSGWHTATADARVRLVRLHDRLDDAVLAARMGVFSLDDQGRSGTLSDRARALLGLGPHSTLSEDVLLAQAAPTDRERLRSALRESWQPDGAGASTVEFRVVHPERGRRWLRAAWRADHNGRPGRVLHGVLQDIDDQKRLTAALSDRAEAHGRLAEERLAHSQALVRDMQQIETHERLRLAHILHCDLQQLLFSARMLAATERDRHQGDRSRLKSIVDTLDEAIAATRGLTARIAPAPIEDLGLGGALTALAELVDQRFELSVELRLPPDPPAVREDLVRFVHDCVQELLFNVVRHAGVDEARVEVEVQRGDLIARVVDDGHGFDAGRRRATPGRGFGLDGLKRQAAAFSGGLTIEARPGEGTRAELRVPLKPASARPLPVSEPRSIEGVTRIVHVEDNAAMRSLVADAIAREADLLLVAQGESGPEGVALALDHRPDVVLMDYVFSWGYDGAEACRRIRAALPETRVVALAGLARDRDRIALHEAGAEAVVSKQTSFTVLFDVVRRARPAGSGDARQAPPDA